jgi:hypothetical protein
VSCEWWTGANMRRIVHGAVFDSPSNDVRRRFMRTLNIRRSIRLIGICLVVAISTFFFAQSANASCWPMRSSNPSDIGFNGWQRDVSSLDDIHASILEYDPFVV